VALELTLERKCPYTYYKYSVRYSFSLHLRNRAAALHPELEAQYQSKFDTVYLRVRSTWLKSFYPHRRPQTRHEGSAEYQAAATASRLLLSETAGATK
jgi:hypothetical protein